MPEEAPVQRLHVIATFLPEGADSTRINIEVFGDLTPAGAPIYDPSRPMSNANKPSGPPYSTGLVLEGRPLADGIDLGTVSAIGIDVRDAIQHRVTKMLRLHADGKKVPVK